MDNREENENQNTGEEEQTQQQEQQEQDPLAAPFSGGNERYRDRGLNSIIDKNQKNKESVGINNTESRLKNNFNSNINNNNNSEDISKYTEDNDQIVKGYNSALNGLNGRASHQNNRNNTFNNENQARNSFFNRMSNIKQVRNKVNEFRENPEETAKNTAKDIALKEAKLITKAIPLPVKIALACIAGGFLFMIILVAVLNEEEEDTTISSGETYTVGNDQFWWPIAGSNDVTMDSSYPTDVAICANCHFMFRWGREHTGLDLHGGPNIIAAMDGVVVDANDGCDVGNKSCGREWGNFVQIKHNNGTYTGYAHMVKGSVKVKVGEEVKQGQVLGKMGMTGNSTGVHLHFEIRVGENSRKSAVDPLTYIDPNNPRPSTQKMTIPNDASNVQRVCLVLKSNGYTDSAIAGIIGNMQRESGVDPTIINYIKCVGIVQWCYSRKTALQNAFGSAWSNLDNQINYMLKEMNAMSSMKKYMMENHTPSEQADKFCYEFERPEAGECAKSYRRDYANQVYSFVQNGCK